MIYVSSRSTLSYQILIRSGPFRLEPSVSKIQDTNKGESAILSPPRCPSLSPRDATSVGTWRIAFNRVSLASPVTNLEKPFIPRRCRSFTDAILSLAETGRGHTAQGSKDKLPKEAYMCLGIVMPWRGSLAIATECSISTPGTKSTKSTAHHHVSPLAISPSIDHSARNGCDGADSLNALVFPL